MKQPAGHIVPPTTHRSGGRIRRTILIAAVVAVACGSFACNRLGVFLYAQDALQHADAILVLAGSRMERPLEAADLCLEGWAKYIVLTRDRPDGGLAALEKRGIVLPGNAEIARDVMIRLGVPAESIVILPDIHDNTAHEAHSLRLLSSSRGWRRVIVVSSKFHTRRAGFALRRELKGSGVEIIMRGSRYDPENPHIWWQTRSGIRWAASESQKLLAYILGLGM